MATPGYPGYVEGFGPGIIIADGPDAADVLLNPAIRLNFPDATLDVDPDTGAVTVHTGASSTPTLEDVLLAGADAGGVAITNLLDPTDPQDAATKQYVDDAIGGGGGWTVLNLSADQANAVHGTFAPVPELTFAMVTGHKYRVRYRAILTNTDGGTNGGTAKFQGPAMTAYHEQMYDQGFGVGGNLHSGNISNAAPIVFQNGNAGTGAIDGYIVCTPSADGDFFLSFGPSAGGTGVTTMLAGAFVEWSEVT